MYMYVCVCACPTALSVLPPQIVQVTGEDEEDWYSGVVNGKKGVFPATFVQLILDDPPSSDSQAKPNGV